MIKWGKFDFEPKAFVNWNKEKFLANFTYIENAEKLWTEIEKANGITTSVSKKSKVTE